MLVGLWLSARCAVARFRRLSGHEFPTSFQLSGNWGGPALLRILLAGTGVRRPGNTAHRILIAPCRLIAMRIPAVKPTSISHRHRHALSVRMTGLSSTNSGASAPAIAVSLADDHRAGHAHGRVGIAPAGRTAHADDHERRLLPQLHVRRDGVCVGALPITFAFLLLSMVKERGELRHKTAALIDPLTGLANRCAFLSDAEHFMAREPKHDESLTVMLADLDRFKAVNDQFGHAVGDRVLQIFADTITRTLRPMDISGRLGGEEFAFLIPERTTEAERIAGASASSSPRERARWGGLRSTRLSGGRRHRNRARATGRPHRCRGRRAVPCEGRGTQLRVGGRLRCGADGQDRAEGRCRVPIRSRHAA